MCCATNTGITALVDNKGQIVARLPYEVRDTLTAQAQMRQGHTPLYAAGFVAVVAGKLADSCTGVLAQGAHLNLALSVLIL